ncbi:MAG: ABC transporter permease [Gordonia sp. (in: high G+C Gram-positive bacteria)]
MLIVVALIEPTLVRFDPGKVVGASQQAPNAMFWFGTDGSGLDVFSRTIAATRLNMIIACAVTLIATGAGCVIGLVLGMNEAHGGIIGYAARGLSRVLDLIQAVPAILLGLVVVALFGNGTVTLILAIAVILLPLQARLVRTETMRIRSEAYLDAARLSGQSEAALIRRHVCPNAIGPAVNNLSVIFAVAIIITAGLGFVGVGVSPPTAEWGSMLATGATDAQSGRWWSATFPALALFASVGALSLANGFLTRQRRR